jgi:N-acetylmuramoyl-L-alanine amidase
MNLNKLIFTENACYKAGRKIKVKGIMVHSTGANNPYLKRYVGPDDGKLGKNQYNNHWNQPMDRAVCVHGFIGKLQDGSIATYQTLPWDHRGWHAGGAANNTHTSFEICEDGLNDRSYFEKVYKEAIELCAYLCKLYRLNPLADGVIIGHYEGHQRGIASNHGDPRHWFSKFGKSMDTFRQDVQKLMSGSSVTPRPSDDSPAKLETGYYRVRKSWQDKKSQIGAYKVLANAKRKADENSGYFVFDDEGTAIYPEKSAAEYGTYTVVSGDSLWRIAAKLLGDGRRYPEIKKLNGLTSDIIHAGQKLKIPGVAPDVTAIKVGDTVRVTASNYATGQTVPNWVKERTHKVSQVEKDKVLLGWPDGIASWLPIDGVKKI